MSDTLGFVFVFTIVLSTVDLVAAVGMTGLQDARDAERVNDTERTLDILEDNTEDIADRDAPSRVAEVKLQDASLMLNCPAESIVFGERAGDPSVNFINTYEVSPIVCESDSSDERTVYAFDTLFRTHDDTGTFVRRPSLVFTDERVLIPAFVTRPDEEAATAVGGSGTFLIHTGKTISDVLVARTEGSYDMNPTVHSSRATLWERKLSGRPDVTCDDMVESPNAYPNVSHYVDGTARVHVVSTPVDTTFAD